MHELPVVSRILDICLKYAADNGAKKIVTIELQIGPLSDLKPEWLQRYFDYVSKDTVAAGARIKIEKMPLLYKCTNCEVEFSIDIEGDNLIDMKSCPECKSRELICSPGRGGGYRIVNMEIV